MTHCSQLTINTTVWSAKKPQVQFRRCPWSRWLHASRPAQTSGENQSPIVDCRFKSKNTPKMSTANSNSNYLSLQIIFRNSDSSHSSNKNNHLEKVRGCSTATRSWYDDLGQTQEMSVDLRILVLHMILHQHCRHYLANHNFSQKRKGNGDDDVT